MSDRHRRSRNPSAPPSCKKVLDICRSDYIEFLEEINIEGYTDSRGTYENNLKLSQERARSVTLYVLNMPGLSSQQREFMQIILTAGGRPDSDLIYDQDTSEYAKSSRRVVFSFTVHDTDSID